MIQTSSSVQPLYKTCTGPANHCACKHCAACGTCPYKTCSHITSPSRPPARRSAYAGRGLCECNAAAPCGIRRVPAEGDGDGITGKRLHDGPERSWWRERDGGGREGDETRAMSVRVLVRPHSVRLRLFQKQLRLWLLRWSGFSGKAGAVLKNV